MRSLVYVSILAFAAASSLPAMAQQTTPAAKPAAKAKTLSAKVTNKRSVAVRSLQFIPAEEEVLPDNILKNPLPKGKTVTLQVSGPKGECNFIIVGEYEDGLEIAGGEVNLCKDNNIVLVD